MHAALESGRLDLDLACLLVVDRERSVGARMLSVEEVADEVLPLLRHLDVPAPSLLDLEAFRTEVRDVLDRLVEGGSLWTRDYGGVARFCVRSAAGSALASARQRIGRDPGLRRDFERLDRDVTLCVLEAND